MGLVFNGCRGTKDEHKERAVMIRDKEGGGGTKEPIIRWFVFVSEQEPVVRV